MIDPIGLGQPVSSAYAAGPSRPIERAERVPDNEAAERTAKAPLAPYQGNAIDVEA